MQRAVIAIGVEKTGGLPTLQAAVKSARAFAEWARTHQRIRHVRLITDEKSPVTRDKVFAAVQSYTALGYIEQLIVYFSGHGINVGHGERWLLSKAPDDPAAAVNVPGSAFNARFCGISHVVFVSDACRTAADSIHAQNVTGSEIFPNAMPSGPERPVDQFYATLVGHPALEVKSATEAAEGYRATYSDVLLAALRGEVHALIDPDPAGHVIRAWPLKKHLLVAVPHHLRDLGVTSRTQQPDARIESEPTAWLSICPPPSAGETDAAAAERRSVGRRRHVSVDERKLSVTLSEREASVPGGLVADGQAALTLALRPEVSGPRRRRIRSVRVSDEIAPVSVQQAVARAAKPFGPALVETGCGIKVRGARIAEAVSSGAVARVGDGADVVQFVLGASGQPAQAALRLEDGSAVVIPIVAGLLASLSFDGNGLLEDIAYEPSANSSEWAAYEAVAAEARRVRAAIAGTASLGILRLELPEEADRLVQHIVRLPSADPALAVVAAYALHDRRMRDAVRLLNSNMTARLGVPIFDLALLAFTLTGSPDSRPAMPGVPMLAQGWSLLDPLGIDLPAGLRTLRAHLRPSVWTHVAPDAAEGLLEAVRTGKVD